MAFLRSSELGRGVVGWRRIIPMHSGCRWMIHRPRRDGSECRQAVRRGGGPRWAPAGGARRRRRVPARGRGRPAQAAARGRRWWPALVALAGGGGRRWWPASQPLAAARSRASCCRARIDIASAISPRPIIAITSSSPLSESEEPRLKSLEPVVKSLDYNVLAEAIDEANRKPKLGVYSPLAAAILRYKAITTPRYSMGSELRAVIEQALKERYPELSEQVEKALAKK